MFSYLQLIYQFITIYCIALELALSSFCKHKAYFNLFGHLKYVEIDKQWQTTEAVQM